MPLPEVAAVIARERGGLVPETLIAAVIARPLGQVRIRYRDENNDIDWPAKLAL